MDWKLNPHFETIAVLFIVGKGGACVGTVKAARCEVWGYASLIRSRMLGLKRTDSRHMDAKTAIQR